MTLSFLFREFHLTFFLRLFNDDELLVCWFGRIFLFPSILNGRFAQQNILGCALLLSAMSTCHRSRFLPLNAPLKVGSPFSSSRGLLQAFRRQPCWLSEPLEMRAFFSGAAARAGKLRTSDPFLLKKDLCRRGFLPARGPLRVRCGSRPDHDSAPPVSFTVVLPLHPSLWKSFSDGRQVILTERCSKCPERRQTKDFPPLPAGPLPHE